MEATVYQIDSAGSIYNVDSTRNIAVNFAPASVTDEVLQNVATIIATPIYSVPYDRQLGVDMQFLDDPMPVSQANMIISIANALKRFEPRCALVDVTFKTDALEGITRPSVRVAING